MQSIEGIVTIVQESRFQLIDSKGVAHHFLLSHKAALEPQQLAPLQREQAQVRVWFKPATGIIGHTADRIARSEASARGYAGVTSDGSAALDRPSPDELGQEHRSPIAGGTKTSAAHEMQDWTE